MSAALPALWQDHDIKASIPSQTLRVGIVLRPSTSEASRTTQICCQLGTLVREPKAYWFELKPKPQVPQTEGQLRRDLAESRPLSPGQVVLIGDIEF